MFQIHCFGHERLKYAARGSGCAGLAGRSNSPLLVSHCTASGGKYRSPSVRTKYEVPSVDGPPRRAISPSVYGARGDHRLFTTTDRICSFSFGHQTSMGLAGVFVTQRL